MYWPQVLLTVAGGQGNFSAYQYSGINNSTLTAGAVKCDGPFPVMCRPTIESVSAADVVCAEIGRKGL